MPLLCHGRTVPARAWPIDIGPGNNFNPHRDRSTKSYFARLDALSKFLLAAALVLIGLEAMVHADLLSRLVGAPYLPHRYCYLQQPWLVWTNVTMDGLIAISYAIIFLSLFWIAGELRSIQDLRNYIWMLIAFGTFIVACGATHLMELITVWWPAYPLSAGVKVLCAAASVPTAILFACAAPALARAIRHFLDVLSTTKQEKDHAVRALLASEKLAVAGRISATISHEIKNPMDTAGNILYLLSTDGRVPSDLVDLAVTASSELRRASEIAQNNLSLFRTSIGPTPLSLSGLVESVLALQTAQMTQRGISLQTRLRAPQLVNAYSGELRQILINLIQNAVAASRENGRILVRVQPRRSVGNVAGYSITIADSGHGINPDHRAHLFTMFFTTKGDQGNGMGLWLVRSMVEKQGGRVRLRSRTAAECRKPGTIFNVWIPLEPAPIATSSATDPLWKLATT
jgi:signal transduction histidine kinase